MRLLLALPLSLWAGWAAAQARAPDVTLDGVLTRADHQTYKELPFIVPAGVTRLTLELDYEGGEQRTVVDLGLRDPERFRGWSGGIKARITVAEQEATASYLPGPLPPGEWRVVLGVPNIRAGVTAPYRARVWYERTGAAFQGFAAAPLKAGPGWFRGDLHTHTAHSDGACAPALGGERVPCPVHRTVKAAEAADLDFVAVTDHNTTSQSAALRELQPHHPRLLLLPGQEVTTFQGHANVVGPVQGVAFQVGSPRAPTMAATLTEARALGGLVIVNHPALPSGEPCMGCGWTAPDTDWSKVDAIEVVNGGAVRTLNGAVETPLSGVAFWEARLNEGHRLTAIGASDNHDAGLPVSTPSAVGRPHTVVWAESLSQPAVLAGIRSGRAFVDLGGSGRPELSFTADSRGRTAEMGSDLTVPDGQSVRFRTAVTGVDGARVEVIDRGRVLAVADGRDFTITSDGTHRWLRVNVRAADGRLLLIGNPIHLNAPRRAEARE